MTPENETLYVFNFILASKNEHRCREPRAKCKMVPYPCVHSMYGVRECSLIDDRPIVLSQKYRLVSKIVSRQDHGRKLLHPSGSWLLDASSRILAHYYGYRHAAGPPYSTSTRTCHCQLFVLLNLLCCGSRSLALHDESSSYVYFCCRKVCVLFTVVRMINYVLRSSAGMQIIPKLLKIYPSSPSPI